MNGIMSLGITVLALVWFFTSHLYKIETPVPLFSAICIAFLYQPCSLHSHSSDIQSKTWWESFCLPDVQQHQTSLIPGSEPCGPAACRVHWQPHPWTQPCQRSLMVKSRTSCQGQNEVLREIRARWLPGTAYGNTVCIWKARKTSCTFF